MEDLALGESQALDNRKSIDNCTPEELVEMGHL